MARTKITPLSHYVVIRGRPGNARLTIRQGGDGPNGAGGPSYERTATIGDVTFNEDYWRCEQRSWECYYQYGAGLQGAADPPMVAAITGYGPWRKVAR